MLLPFLKFIPGAMQKFSPVAYDFVSVLIAAIGCSAHYCSKHGLDFSLCTHCADYLSSEYAHLQRRIFFLSLTLSTNLILLVVYLVAGIFGLFLGDLAFGDKRRLERKGRTGRSRGNALRQSAVKWRAWETWLHQAKSPKEKHLTDRNASLHADRRLHRRNRNSRWRWFWLWQVPFRYWQKARSKRKRNWRYLKRIRTLTASRSQFVQIVFISAKIKCPSRTL